VVQHRRLRDRRGDGLRGHAHVDQQPPAQPGRRQGPPGVDGRHDRRRFVESDAPAVASADGAARRDGGVLCRRRSSDRTDRSSGS
jgi:hypothetical protein